MNQLHIIAHSLSPEQLTHHIERFVSPKDSLLFIGDAVICLIRSDLQDVIKSSTLPVYVLEADLKCRGIVDSKINDATIINDADMVELSLNHKKSISW